MSSESQRIRSVALDSSGHLTISPKARKQLGMNKGGKLIETVIGKCVILTPENRTLLKAQREAQASLKRAGVTVAELKSEVERIRQDRFARQFPDLV